MRWSTTHKLDRLEIGLTMNGITTAAARLLGRLRRQMFRHVLPFVLMLLVAGWLTLKAGAYIAQVKNPQTYAKIAEPTPNALPHTAHD